VQSKHDIDARRGGGRSGLHSSYVPPRSSKGVLYPEPRICNQACLAHIGDDLGPTQSLSLTVSTTKRHSHCSSALWQHVRVATATASRQCTTQFRRRRLYSCVQPVLAGNTVHNDYQFLRRRMRRVFDALSFRLVDVSSFHEVSRRWVPTKVNLLPEKQRHHRCGTIL
jgi:hypothetical protein